MLSGDSVPVTVAPVELLSVTAPMVPPAAVTVMGTAGLTAAAPFAGLNVSVASGSGGLDDVDGAADVSEDETDDSAGPPADAACLPQAVRLIAASALAAQIATIRPRTPRRADRIATTDLRDEFTQDIYRLDRSSRPREAIVT